MGGVQEEAGGPVEDWHCWIILPCGYASSSPPLEEFKKKLVGRAGGSVGRREGWHCWIRLRHGPPLPLAGLLRNLILLL